MLMDSSYRPGPSSVLSYTGLALQSYLRLAEEIVRSAVERANEEKLPYPPTPPYPGYRSSGGGMAMNAL